MDSLRNSGIEMIGDIPWGTHIASLYSSGRDFCKVVAPYIKSGLINNELCIWIYSQTINHEEAKEIIRTSVESVDTYLKNGRLILLPYTQWYVLEGSFNDLRVNRQWLELLEYARDNGFDGLRAVGDTAWLEKSYYRDFEYYEQKINDVFREYPFIALCLYDMKRTGMAEVADIMNNHSFTIVSDNSEMKIVRNIELLIKERELADSRKMLSEMVELDKIKTEFFANISHELRTPLTVILSSIQMMQLLKDRLVCNECDSRTDARLGKYLKIIQQNCYRQLRLVNNLIDVSKIDSDYYELNMQNCNIVELVENIAISVAEYIKSRGITLEFDTELEELCIACDPDQIERIILNLLSNAIKFTDRGGYIRVNISGGTDKVVIRIEDTGTGIPQDKLDCIFERFQQVENTLTRNHEGSGIGLSLVKSLVEKHNGKISVKSELGKGADFMIELPCKPKQDIGSGAALKDYACVKNSVEKINVEFSDIYL